ncbi:MAG TPA: GDP-mannose 4,6-dehydratase [Ferruginibacter sp.]|nr:GDP-mannose 4,6-dehydratase [Ferruginibacter sp.]
MKILLTGFSGFVSKHFLDMMNVKEPGTEIIGIAREQPTFDIASFENLNIKFCRADLLDKASVDKILSEFQPEYILHLASVSSVALSWQTPYESFVNNTNIFLNVVEQVRLNKFKCRILSVGSSEEYGEVSEDLLPLAETYTLKPVSPYAVARVSQEMLSKIYAEGYDLDIVMTRSFNHIGPGQKENFVISSFAKQLIQMSQHPSGKNILIAGDVSIIRDFLDVRDVVEAYLLLLKNGKSGEIYNICSGHGRSLNEIIQTLASQLGINVTVKTDPARVRPNENKKVIGSNQKIREELGWAPKISFEESLADILSYWKNKLQEISS